MFTVYTKDYCPYCTMTKQLFTRLDIPYQEVDISADPKAFEELQTRSKMRTVPQIFLSNTCLGGYTDIVKLHEDGQLVSLYEKSRK